jgi:hypothetical protein
MDGLEAPWELMESSPERGRRRGKGVEGREARPRGGAAGFVWFGPCMLSMAAMPEVLSSCVREGGRRKEKGERRGKKKRKEKKKKRKRNMENFLNLKISEK